MGDLMKVDYNAIGRRIKEKRRELQQTQDILAEALSVSVGYVSQIERGVTKLSLDMLVRIAECLECEPAELLIGVAPGSRSYLDRELRQAYDRMDARQRELLLEIAWAFLRRS